jgi:hypothetical protein
MYAPTDNAPPSQLLPAGGTPRPSRASLRTRPRIQRITIRSWEYIPAVRAALLAVRLLGVLALSVIGIALLTISDQWGLLLLALAVASAPLSAWVFTTAARGWPVAAV